MKITFPTRGHLIATLVFSVPLAALGFQAASWWGVVAGAVVGAVIAARMMLRGAVEAAASHTHTVILTGPPANASTFRANAITRDIRAQH